jgi:site-specific DNA-methyltransferase (adenine-specific)
MENAVLIGDCLDLLPTLPAGSADLVFADPPFNIGLDYPDHDDSLPPAEYLAWLEVRLRAACRVLSPTGSIFVAISTQYQAEVGVLLKGFGLHWRSTLPWHYTFGPCQRRKFTPSWVAIHYLTADRQRFTFNADAVKVPSARQRVYRDKRAKAGGKVPDDVWVLRPQDEPAAFRPDADVWHVPRVAGTFRERVGHVCQMPLPVLERIVRVASNPGELVLDPFTGTGTTLVAAKRHGRRWLGIDICPATAELARARVDAEPGLSHTG